MTDPIINMRVISGIIETSCVTYLK